MKINLFLFEEHIFVLKKESFVWQYHFIRGEESTCVIGWSIESWDNFAKYIAKSLGRDNLNEVDFSLLSQPKMNKYDAALLQVFPSIKHDCLLSLLQSKYGKCEVGLYFNSVLLGFYREGFISPQPEKSKEGSLLQLLNQEISDEKADEEIIDLEKNNSDKNGISNVSISLGISKENMDQLNLTEQIVIKDGYVYGIASSGFYVVVDDVSMYVPKYKVAKHNSAPLRAVVSEGQKLIVCMSSQNITVEITL